MPTDGGWGREPGDDRTLVEFLLDRVEADGDSELLDVLGEKVTAAELQHRVARVAGGLRELSVTRGDRVAMLIDNSMPAVLALWATIEVGAIAVPINTAYKGEFLRNALVDSDPVVFVVDGDLAPRLDGIGELPPALAHVVVVGDQPGVERRESTGGSMPARHRWDDFVATDPASPHIGTPADLAALIYTGGTTGPAKGCMISHACEIAVTVQVAINHRRTPDDVVYSPLPMFHNNVLTFAIFGPPILGGRGAVGRKFSVSQFWPEINRVGATKTGLLGSMAHFLAHDVDRPEMPRSGAPEANRTLGKLAAAPMPQAIDAILHERFGLETCSGGYGQTEACLLSWLPPGVENRVDAAGVLNTEYFDVRIFDDDDHEVPRGESGEIVARPRRPHVMFDGYWRRPEATVNSSRNWWYHTGDIGRVDGDDYLYFLDRKDDYVRRRGENVSTQEIENIVMGYGGFVEVAVHAVPSDATEDDVKLTAVLTDDATVTHEELFTWCVDRVPYFALPRYIEFRDHLPHSPLDKVLKRQLRDEGVTAATWDREQSDVTFEKR